MEEATTAGPRGAVTAAAPHRRAIRRLDPSTIAQIAAGEVVERPASVVKELVENAVDAGAREVSVRLEGGGLEGITVEDDGSGIRPSELALAVERHATSKLGGADDLAAVSTLGFRGEALAAISSISRLRLISRPPGDEEAHGVSVVGGAIVGEFVQGRDVGTTVEVQDLFFNTPARLKFQHAAPAEQVEVSSTLEHLYLARPDVGLLLTGNGREVARYPPTTSVRDAAAYVLGSEFLDQSLPVHGESASGIGVEGIVGKPTISRSTAQGIYLSVNGRTVQSKGLVQAVRQAYSEVLPRTRYPVGVLRLTLDPARVDVNVHPTKREVRIAQLREVEDLVRRSVRASLQSAPQVAERPAVSPGAPQIPPMTLLSVPRAVPEPSPLYLPLAAIPAGRQTRLTPPEGRFRVAAGPGHPAFEILGSLFQLYWVAEGEGAILLIDQHAASERVVFEALMSSGQMGRQELLQPVRVELTARQATVLHANASQIAAAGFEVEPFGGGAHRVTQVPVFRGRLTRAEALLPLLDELGDGGRPTVPDGVVERVTASIACHTAVRAGDVISADEIGRVIEGLHGLEGTGFACPHGRPIIVRFGRGQIDRWFLRSEP